MKSTREILISSWFASCEIVCVILRLIGAQRDGFSCSSSNAFCGIAIVRDR